MCHKLYLSQRRALRVVVNFSGIEEEKKRCLCPSYFNTSVELKVKCTQYTEMGLPLTMITCSHTFFFHTQTHQYPAAATLQLMTPQIIVCREEECDVSPLVRVWDHIYSINREPRSVSHTSTYMPLEAGVCVYVCEQLGASICVQYEC